MLNKPFFFEGRSTPVFAAWQIQGVQPQLPAPPCSPPRPAVSHRPGGWPAVQTGTPADQSRKSMSARDDEWRRRGRSKGGGEASTGRDVICQSRDRRLHLDEAEKFLVENAG
eukprot:760078-Hanusia_phi.AAC.4